MDERQRRILTALGGAVAFFAVLLLFLMMFDGDDDSDVSTGRLQRESTTSSSASTTVIASTTTISSGGSTSTSGRTTSTTRASNSTTSSTTPTPAPAELAEVTSEGAVLQSPGPQPPHEFGSDCASLADRGGSWDVECGGVTSQGEDLIWLVQQRRGGGELRAYLFRHLRPTDRWVVELAAGDDEGRFSDAIVRVQDVSGDGEPELAYGFRNHGTGQILDLDVVEAPGRVAVHRTLDHGSAAVSLGRLDDWAAQFEPGDPNCCPSSYLHSVIRFFDADGTWRIVRQDETSEAPPGNF